MKMSLSIKSRIALTTVCNHIHNVRNVPADTDCVLLDLAILKLQHLFKILFICQIRAEVLTSEQIFITGNSDISRKRTKLIIQVVAKCTFNHVLQIKYAFLLEIFCVKQSWLHNCKRHQSELIMNVRSPLFGGGRVAAAADPFEFLRDCH